MDYLGLTQLRLLIGQRVSYHGASYTVLEVLEEAPALVMVADHPDIAIQADSYGNPRRQVAQTLTIPALTSDGAEPHPNFLDITLL